jgi:hypothetical protein
MTLYEDLKDIVSQINTFVDSLWKFISLEISQEGVEALLASKADDDITSLFTSSVQYDTLDSAVKKILYSINLFNTKIDSDDIIPRDDYKHLRKSINNSSLDVRYIALSLQRRFNDGEITLEYQRKLDLYKSKYEEILNKLNECVVKYNNRCHHSQSLRPLFSVDLSPIKVL